MKNRWKVIMALILISGIAQAGYVTIGNVENADDGLTGFGAVGYEYNIGQYEVTIAEWDVFATATGVGGGNENYWNDGTHGSVGTAAPVTYVTLHEAMQYCNWLTTGDVESGVYTFAGGVYSSTMSRTDILAGGLDAVATDTNKVYALPTEDEWYKAAYYTGNAYTYFSDGNPVYTVPPNGSGNWNYNTNTTWTAGTGATEQNGTEDMMGNVNEWVEDSSGRVRGQNYSLTNGGYMRRDLSGSAFPATSQFFNTGFRAVELMPQSVAPEPELEINYTNEVPYLLTAPVVDGTINPGEYGNSMLISFVNTPTNPGAMWLEGTYDHTDTDKSAVMYLAYTDDSLFLGFDVTDDFVDNTPEDATWNNDNIEIFIDGDQNDNDFKSGNAGPEGFQILVDSADQAYLIGSGVPYTSKAVTWPATNGYTVEIEIPLSSIDTADGAAVTNATTGDILRFNVGMVENDYYLTGLEAYGALWMSDTNGTPNFFGEIAWDTGLKLADRHLTSTIVSFSHFSGDVYEMVVDSPTPWTSFPKSTTDLNGSWSNVGNSINSAGPFAADALGVVGTNTIYIQSGTDAAFFGIGEQ